MPVYDYRTTYPEGTNANNPIIVYDQFLFDNPGGFVGDSPSNTPVSNLGNPSTAEYWQAAQQSTVAILPTLTVEVNAIAIAPHNIKGQYLRVEVVRDNQLVGNYEIGAVDNESPICLIFEQTYLPGDFIRLFIISEQEGFLTRFGMVMAGMALVLPNRIYAGHTPVNFARKTSALNGMSESGEFLGRVILSETLESSFPMENVDAAFYRQQVEPFAKSAKEDPFVLCWRPGSFPNETALCWATNDLQMENKGGRKKVGFSLSYKAHVPWQQ